MKATKLSSVSAFPLPPAISAKKSSAGLLMALMWRRSMSIMWDWNMAAVKSPRPDVSGAASSVAAASFSSSLSTRSVASLTRRCATNLCSWSLRRPSCLCKVACNVVSCSRGLLISESSEEDASAERPLASRCRERTKLRAASTAAAASFWLEPALSQAFFMASGDISSSLAKPFVASTASSTFVSAVATDAATSLRMVEALRFDMPCFVSAKALAAALRRSCKAPRASPVDSLTPSPRRLAARRFIARKVFAPPTEV
mmetsp:Transcript_15845/g.34664  ORF Transcript_15845/g.34664 Transcript_15845/m.34664 type:complete len:258 (-) Transcript_15845:1108-1881(-)